MGLVVIEVEVGQSSPHSESEGAKGTKTELQVQILELPPTGCVTKPYWQLLYLEWSSWDLKGIGNTGAYSMLVPHLCISPKAQQSKESVIASSLSWLRGCSIIILQCDSILSLLTSQMFRQHSTYRHTNAKLPHILMSGACRGSFFLWPTRHFNSKLDSERGHKECHRLRTKLQGKP